MHQKALKTENRFKNVLEKTENCANCNLCKNTHLGALYHVSVQSADLYFTSVFYLHFIKDSHFEISTNQFLELHQSLFIKLIPAAKSRKQ